VPTATAPATDPITAVADSLGHGTGYRLRADGGWLHFDPTPGRPLLQQGWKLHVSAGLADAAETLRRVALVVMPHQLRFKVARSIEQLIALCGPPTPVSQVGKFITIYLEDDDQLAPLAEQLHQQTKEFSAPVVPSDRRYQRGSNVYLRYGGFIARSSFANAEQARRFYIVDPAGRPVTDARRPGQYRPDWAIERGVPARQVDRARGPGLFGRDIRIGRVLRQSAKGGVFRARWRDREVVVKEARLGTCPDLQGRDARSRLRNEWELLNRLRGTGLAPEPLEFFVEESNAYLIEEFLPGVPLRRLVTDANYLGNAPPEQLGSWCQAVTELVSAARSHGVRPRDLTPNNILVHDGRFTLIDLELCEAVDSAAPPFDGWTPGYARPRSNRIADAGDLDYALAAVKYFILTGLDPYLDHSGAGIAEQIPGLLDAFAPVDRPALAPELSYVRDQLGRSGRAAERPPASPDQVLSEAVEAGLELVHQTDWDQRDWPWPSKWASPLFHPACFHTGTAGVTRYYLDLWAATGDQQWVAHADELLSWTLVNHPFIAGETPTGLHFGVASLPWLLTETAEAAEASRAGVLRDQAAVLSGALAGLASDSSDLTHGLAGIGLGQLAANRPEQAGRIAAQLLARVQHRDGLPVWLRGDEYSYGYAHGSAGIGYFLLRAAERLADPSLHQVAIDIAHRLVGLGLPTASGAGLSWRSGPTSDQVPWTHWCNGAAGVGSFLLAAAKADGDPELAAAARRAGRAISHGRGYGSCGRCHGLAGDGDYLVQLATAEQDQEFWQAAGRIDRRLEALKIRRGAAWKWPDESGSEPRPAYQRGYLGVHAFRLQLAGLLPVGPRNF
jgi:tRNA A-37 threonylcarbamoyl transferase component Bud32/mono/diheme cytochrome c family protein